jgi:hypothetical protein
VGEYLQIFRAGVPQPSVAALLEIRPAAIAEAQRLCPELLRAQLVRLDDGTWLDVLTWGRPDGQQRPRARVAEFHAVTRMHDLLADVEEPLRGEIVPTSSRCVTTTCPWTSWPGEPPRATARRSRRWSATSSTRGTGWPYGSWVIPTTPRTPARRSWFAS